MSKIYSVNQGLLNIPVDECQNSQDASMLDQHTAAASKVQSHSKRRSDKPPLTRTPLKGQHRPPRRRTPRTEDPRSQTRVGQAANPARRVRATAPPPSPRGYSAARAPAAPSGASRGSSVFGSGKG